MISELKVGTKTVALLLDPSDMDFGTEPVSAPEAALQVLMMKRPAQSAVAKHSHKHMERITSVRQKALVVIKGSMQVTVCDLSGVDGDSCTVGAGQCLYLVDGGYTIEMKEDCTFFEFKNGPHVEDKIML